MMIYLFTPVEENGGILQFSVTFAVALQKIHDCMLFVPDTVNSKFLTILSGRYKTYKKIKSINMYHPGIVTLCNQIAEDKPEHVVFLEDSILMQQMCCLLHNKSISGSVVVHDTIHHPCNNMTYRKKIIELLRQLLTKKTVNTAENIILLSNHSKEEFHNQNKRCKAQKIIMRLGAHVPSAIPACPQELDGCVGKYILFFGRIDKYKGIEDLCNAYNTLSKDLQKSLKLIIAGKGVFSDKELQLIKNSENIITINRFIEDQEMLWLTKNSEIVALPYIEATQSGVLPIAYHYGKPIIIRNLPGLVENAEIGKTAVVFDTVSELSILLEKTANNELKFQTQDICNYYSENFNWENNIHKLLEQII